MRKNHVLISKKFLKEYKTTKILLNKKQNCF